MYREDLHFHFTGIGGYGMSCIAEVLINQGYRVSGSDLVVNDLCERLIRIGATIHKGHDATSVAPDVTHLVYSSAVPQDNVELDEARERGIPVIPRAEVLAELMRRKYGVAVGGSHGKTTTTSMIAQVLDAGGLDPTVFVGGQVPAFGDSGGRVGRSEYLVAESDESDKSFLMLSPTVAVVTNIDDEHLETYGSSSELDRSFLQFINSVPFYGTSILGIDNPRVRAIARETTRRVTTFGIAPDAYIRAEGIIHGGGQTRFTAFRGHERLFEVPLVTPGVHMVTNALAAIAVGLEFDIAPETIAEALVSFRGVRRRLELLSEQGGVRVFNDYGHHPSEIEATIRALRVGWGEACRSLRVLFQPHRYTRTKICFSGFVNAFRECDEVIVGEIYSAGEAPLPGISGRSLYQAIDHPHKHFVEDLQDAVEGLVKSASPGDFILCPGAGSIGKTARTLAEHLCGT